MRAYIFVGCAAPGSRCVLRPTPGSSAARYARPVFVSRLRCGARRAGLAGLLSGLLWAARAAPVQAQPPAENAALPPVAVFDIVCKYRNQTYTLHGYALKHPGSPAIAQFQTSSANDLDYRFPTGICGALCAYFNPYAERPPTLKKEPRVQTLPPVTLGGVLCRVVELSDPPPPPAKYMPAIPPLPHVLLRWAVAPDGRTRHTTGTFGLFKSDGKTPDPDPLVMEADYTFREPLAGAARPGSALPLHTLTVPLKDTLAVRAIACSSTLPLLAVAANDGSVSIWNTNTQMQLHSLSNRPGWGQSLTVSGDGKRLAVGTFAQSGVVQVWNMQTGKTVQTIDTKSQGIFCLTLSPDGRLLATQGFAPNASEPIRVWNVETGKTLVSLDEPGAMGMVFAPDGKTLATGSVFAVHLWDTKTWKQKLGLQQDAEGWVFTGDTPLVFSPDSKLLAVGDTHTRGISVGLIEPQSSTPSEATVTRIWDAQTGRRLQTLFGTTGSIPDLSFSPDGATLAIVDSDTTEEGNGKNSAVLLWDTRTWKQKGTAALEHGKTIAGVAWTADGKALVTSYSDAILKFWALPAP